MDRTDKIKLSIIKLNQLIGSGVLTPIQEFEAMELMIELDRQLLNQYEHATQTVLLV